MSDAAAADLPDDLDDDQDDDREDDAPAPAGRRRRSRDPLGLRRALSDRLLPGLVAAMALLAALALAGAHGAAGLSERWRAGAAAVTAQIPDATAARLDSALAILRMDPAIAAAEAVPPARVSALLRPWLGDAPTLPLPGVLAVTLRDEAAVLAPLASRLAEAVPGAEIEAHGLWVARLGALARSVQGLALVALALVAGVAAAVVAVATRAGLAARREAIALLHDLGARRGDIAGRFSRRIGTLAATGAVLGTALAVPGLLALAHLAAPFTGGTASTWTDLPWTGLLLLAPTAWAIGWVTAQATVRRWLRHLP